MKLTTGSRLGTYRIEKFLSSGGMGEVYLGRHVELGRRVAIKVLAESVAADDTAVKRFRREARAASNLSHPHICTLFDFCEEAGVSFLVLEYLEGETLEERVRKHRFSHADAVRIGAEVAEALDHAHTHGFVHRDLKPGNVMLTEQGAKVLDFGLVASTTPGDGPILTVESASSAPITAHGAIVGTMPYMAPEQVDGGAADARTDIYALGVMLYEMVCGRRPFTAASPIALAAEILEAAPTPLRDREPALPVHLEHVIERCMARNPDDRWQSARDLAAELRWQSTARHQVDAAPTGIAGVRSLPRLWLATAVTAAIVLITSLLLLAMRERGADTASGPIAFGIPAPADVAFTEGVRNVPALSPDGRRLLFLGTESSGRSRIFVRELSNPRANVVAGTDGAFLPFWSQDGSSFGYFGYGHLWTHRPDGPPPTAVASASLESRGGSWNRDDLIVFAPGPRMGLLAVASNGGATRALTSPNRARGEIGHLWPTFLPDGNSFLYFVSSDVDSVRGVYAGSLNGGGGERIVESTSNALFANGHILYVRGRSLLAQPFDPASRRIHGSPLLLANDVLTTPGFGGGFSVSTTGVLAYWRASVKDATHLVWFDSAGRPMTESSDIGHYRNVDLSRDGKRIALEIYDGSDGDIAIIDIETGRTRPITTPATQERNVVWSPDGRRVAFVAEHADGWVLYALELDATRGREVVVKSQTDMMPTSWSADGRTLLFANRDTTGDYDLFTVGLAPGSSPVPLLHGDALEVSGRFAEAGTAFAYASNESGAMEVFLQPYPPNGQKCQISSGGGYDPHWADHDRRLYYLDAGGTLMRAELGRSTRCPTGVPQRMFRTPIQTPGTSRNHYAISPTDGTFLFNVPASDPATWLINVIVDWPNALTRVGR